MKINRKLVVAGGVAIVLATVTSILLLNRKSLPEASMVDLVQLPRSNSGSDTTEEAERRRGEIYDLKPTGRVGDWVEPEFGTGFGVHITKNDEVEVDHFSMQFESGKERVVRDGLERFTGSRYLENPSRRREKVTHAELKEMASLVTVFNEPAFVAVTSERTVTESKVFPEILDCLYRSSITLHYVPGPKNVE